MGKLDKLQKKPSGLTAKAEMEKAELALAQASDRADRKQISIDAIRYNEENDYSREDTEESVVKLARSIEQTGGPVHNLVVSEQPDKSYVLLSGERRLKALKWLRDEELRKGAEGDPAKWQRTHCLIMSGLTKRQEMIFLDAANLQVRGGIGDERMMRTGTLRYVRNLQEEYGISEEAAVALVEKISTQKSTTIEQSIRIEKTFPKNLLALLNDRQLTKSDSKRLLSLDDADMERLSADIDRLNAARTPENTEKTDAVLQTLIKGLSSTISIENTRQRRAETDRVFAEAEATLAREAAGRRRALSPRESYLNKCSTVLRTLNAFASPKALQKIVEMDTYAENDAENIRAQLTGIRDRVDALLASYEKTAEKDRSQP